MPNNFPFTFNDAVFSELNFFRGPDVSELSKVDAHVQVKVVTENLPERLQVHIRLESEESEDVRFVLEVVGLFDLKEDVVEPDQETVYAFINERAIYILWPYITQMSRILTPQMGMNPMNWNIPQGLFVEPGEANEVLE